MVVDGLNNLKRTKVPDALILLIPKEWAKLSRVAPARQTAAPIRNFFRSWFALLIPTTWFSLLIPVQGDNSQNENSEKEDKCTHTASAECSCFGLRNRE